MKKAWIYYDDSEDAERGINPRISFTEPPNWNYRIVEIVFSEVERYCPPGSEWKG